MCQLKYCWLGWVAINFLIAACTVPQQNLSKYQSNFSGKRVFSQTPTSSPNEGDLAEPLNDQALSASTDRNSLSAKKKLFRYNSSRSLQSETERTRIHTSFQNPEHYLKEDISFWREPLTEQTETADLERQKTDNSYENENIVTPQKKTITEKVIYDIPIVLNKRVKQALNYYLTKRRSSLKAGVRRSGKYLNLIKGILKEEGVPQDLAYLVATESNYNHRAYSHAGAAGLWQFMPATGRLYGLKKDRWVDERLDIVKSTHAAARLLKNLYETFDSWELALAAYNAGEGRVRKGIRIAKARKRPVSYWTLHLPRETKRYVADFMAITVISKNLGKYGLDQVTMSPPLDGNKVELSTDFSLQEVAKRSNVSFKKLLVLNAFLLRGVPPIHQDTYQLYVPAEHRGALMASLQRNPDASIQWKEQVVLADKSLYMARLLKQHGTPVYFRVKEGDNLWQLSKRHNTSVERLRSWNQIKTNNLIRVNQRLKIYLPTWKVYSMLTRETLVASNTSSSKSRIITVRPGETLSRLARKYRVSVKQLQTWNNLDEPEELRAFQKLIISPPQV
ncbi:MAG: LysM peptidoglycan-binding domain-containing protein [SAR324 cluster bacterium]|nr:LysM peptidoglycan-binding domain-containing protein [SAR324 cluster bacterium]